MLCETALFSDSHRMVRTCVHHRMQSRANILKGPTMRVSREDLVPYKAPPCERRRVTRTGATYQSTRRTDRPRWWTPWSRGTWGQRGLRETCRVGQRGVSQRLPMRCRGQGRCLERRMWSRALVPDWLEVEPPWPLPCVLLGDRTDVPAYVTSEDSPPALNAWQVDLKAEDRPGE